MHLNTTAMFSNGTAYPNIQLNETPDTCPQCHSKVHPKHINAQIMDHKKLVQAGFRCTNHDCQEVFLAEYFYRKDDGAIHLYELVKVYPVNYVERDFSENITKISPTFVEIYNQALAAETNSLEQLVGIGLRKALEFLIKDYAIYEHADKEEKIRETQLSQCINNYVEDYNVKECAKRAVWLGNDETHYTRKWETKDIRDLKILVDLSINWIDNVLMTKQFLEDMK